MNASSESGECASLISRGSFSVFEAVCLAAMGTLHPLPAQTYVADASSPTLFFTDQRRMGRAASGTYVAIGRAYFRKQEPNIDTPPRKTFGFRKKTQDRASCTVTPDCAP